MKIKIVNAPKGMRRPKPASGCTELRIDSKRVAVACAAGSPSKTASKRSASPKRKTSQKRQTAQGRSAVQLGTHVEVKRSFAGGWTLHDVHTGAWYGTRDTKKSAIEYQARLEARTAEERKRHIRHID